MIARVASLRTLAVAVFGIGVAVLGAIEARAGTLYENSAFNYRVDAPSGWQTNSTAAANPSVFIHSKLGQVVKFKLARKNQPLTAALGARLQSSDEEKLKARFPAYKAVKVTVSFIGGDAAIHYAFAYRGDDNVIRVVHNAVLSHKDPDGYVWLKLQAVYTNALATESEQALSVLLSGFRWKALQSPGEAPPPAVVENDGPSAGSGGSTQAAITPTPVKPGVVDYTADYISMSKEMSEEDTKQLKANYVGDGHKRTDKEMERARQFFGGGDLFNRTDK